MSLTLSPAMVERILRRCEEVLAGVGMEATPFVVDWYNDFRLEVAADMPQLIEVSGRNRLGVVCLSNKNFFRSAVLGTYRKNIEDGGEAQRKFDFVAEASDDVGRMLRPLLVEEIGRDESFIRVMNVDKPPFLHFSLSPAGSLARSCDIVWFVWSRGLMDKALVFGTKD
ncbi:hypothetical protein FOZ63_008548, partial [Perkinsus olseni]